MNASGLDQLLAIQKAGPDRVGVSRLLGMSLTEVDDGVAVFEARTRPEFGNPHLTLHGGIAATLLDSAMGCAVHSTLPPGVGYTTVDLNVTYLRPASLEGIPLRAEGRVIHRGARVVTAEGRLTDEFDRLIATGTSTCLVLEPRTAGSDAHGSTERAPASRATMGYGGAVPEKG